MASISKDPFITQAFRHAIAISDPINVSLAWGQIFEILLTPAGLYVSVTLSFYAP